MWLGYTHKIDGKKGKKKQIKETSTVFRNLSNRILLKSSRTKDTRSKSSQWKRNNNTRVLPLKATSLEAAGKCIRESGLGLVSVTRRASVEEGSPRRTPSHLICKQTHPGRPLQGWDQCHRYTRLLMVMATNMMKGGERSEEETRNCWEKVKNDEKTEYLCEKWW